MYIDVSSNFSSGIGLEDVPNQHQVPIALSSSTTPVLPPTLLHQLGRKTLVQIQGLLGPNRRTHRGPEPYPDANRTCSIIRAWRRLMSLYRNFTSSRHAYVRKWYRYDVQQAVTI